MKTAFCHYIVWAPTGLLAAFLAIAPAAQASSYTFQTINNNGDPAFNQLLGITNTGTIVGYFGDGTVVPNNGYVVTPPYSQSSFVPQNFPGAFQTQVVGINNSAALTVGFWADTAGDNYGWVKQGVNFIQVVNPNTPAPMVGATTVNQLLGVNNSNVAAGFYTGADANDHGYLYNVTNGTFTAITGPAGATSTMATGINNSGVVSGIVTDGTGTHGFIDMNGTYTVYNDPSGTSTMFFGLNNNNQVVGSYIDSGGLSHGLVYNLLTNTWQTIDDPNASATAAFNVNGTTLNGINDAGQVVGFYSDGTNVDGVLASPVAPAPEPASLALVSLGIIGAAALRRRKPQVR